MAAKAFQTGVLRGFSMKTTPSVARRARSSRGDAMQEASKILANAWTQTGATLSESMRLYGSQR